MSQGLFQPIYPNPYIVGNPIRSREMFFGRMDEFHFIARALDDGRKAALIVLFGERRSGKSSILYQLQNGQLGKTFLPIFVDMQIMAGIANEAEFFGRLITDTGKALGKEGPEITPYILRPDDSNPSEGFRQYLRALKEHFPGRAPLLLIDEYEILENKITEGCLSRHVLTFFGGLLDSEQVSFVFTGSKRLELHNAELWGSELLQKATSRKISFLTRDDTARLVTQPLENKVTFAPEVVEQIYGLTAGQPFYTQLICQNLVYHLNEVKKYFVDSKDLEAVVNGVLDNPPPQMIFNWGEHSSEHKLTLALLAEFSKQPGRYLSTVSIRHRINRSKLDLVLSDAKLKTWLTDLCKDEYLLQQDYRFSFRLDLFRRWIRHDHNIWQVKKEIGQEELDRICEREREKKEKKKKIIIVLERIALAVSAVAAVFLGIWVYNLIFQREVEVSANGGPFSVWVDGDSIGTTNKDNPTQFVIGKKWIFFEKKLKEGETYRFRAKLLETGETMPDTLVTIGENNQPIRFKFREYPVSVVSDADSMILTWNSDTVQTAEHAEPWKHIFTVCAGNYKLHVTDPSTDEKKEYDINVSNNSVHQYVDFDSVVVVTLQSNVDFQYIWSNSRGQRSKPKISGSNSAIIRGCKKATYEFQLSALFSNNKISLDGYDIMTDATITVDFKLNSKPLSEKSKPAPKKLPASTIRRLTIKSNPDSARVILDDTPVGYTPIDINLLPGVYLIELEKEGYDPVTEFFELKSDTTFFDDLKQQYGYLGVKVKDEQGVAPSNVEVSLASEKDEEVLLGKTPKLADDKPLKVGKYTLKIKPTKYDIVSPNPPTVIIRKGANEQITIVVRERRR